MGKTKFGTKIAFFFVILLGAGAVLYAKNCMEQLAAYAVSLMDGAGQAQAQSQLAAMIASDVKKMAAFMAAGLIITIVVGAAGIIDYIRSLDLACSYSDTLAQGDLTQDVEQKYLDRKDSIGNLAAAFHKIRESFAGHLGSVKDNAESLSGHVSSIGKNVDEINGEMEGISATTQQLSYPVLYSGDDEKYLRTDIYGNQTIAGCIFMEGMNTPDFQDYHTILYGHNMKNLSMFGSLKKYKTEDFYKDHQFFTIYTSECAYRYQIFAYYDVPETDEVYTVGFAPDETFQKFIDKMKQKSYDDTGVNVTKDDHIMTLSTCSTTGKRFVVHAVRIGEHALEK